MELGATGKEQEAEGEGGIAETSSVEVLVVLEKELPGHGVVSERGHLWPLVLLESRTGFRSASLVP